MILKRSITATALLFAAVGTSIAATVHLKDGSVIVGSILELNDGDDLIVDTEYMDEVVIEWDAVDRLSESGALDVELFDGRRFSGQLVRDGADISLSGNTGQEFTADEIYQIREFRADFWDGLSVDTNLGMNLVRGNNRVTQVSFGAGLGFENQSYETLLRGTSILNEQENAGDTRRTTLSGSYAHKYDDGWQAFGRMQFESDEQQGLDGRTLLAGGLGKRVQNSRRHRVELYAGLALNAERFEGLPDVETLEGLLGGTYRMRSFADLDATLLLLPSLEESNRLRAQFDAILSFDLYSDLDFLITVYDRYDSQPPVGNDKNDTGITLGLSWSN